MSDDQAVHARGGDFALVVLGAALWGTGGLTGAALGDGLGMLTVATLRLGVGGGLLLVVLGVAGRLTRVPWSREVLVRVGGTAVLAAAYQACYFLAVRTGSVSVATLVALGAAPVLVTTASVVATRRPPAPRTVLAVGLAGSGLVLLLGAPDTGGAGVWLALVASAAFATMTMVNSRPVPGLDALTLTGLSFSAGALLLAPLAVVAGGGLPSTAAGWLLVAYLGLGPTALAYGAYFAGLRTVPPAAAAVLALVEPLTAAVGAAVLRDERLGVLGLAGAGLLVAAVVVLRPRRGAPTMVAGPR